MSPNFAIGVFFAFALGFIFIPETTGTPQSVTLYNSTNCSAPSVVYKANQAIPSPWDKITASFKFSGLWKLSATNGSKTITIFPNGAKRNGICIDKAKSFGKGGYNASQFRFTSAQRIGPVDMTQVQLLLYPQGSFGGSPQTISGNQSSLKLTAQSYAYFGKAAWLLYPNVNFGGTPTCLKHQLGQVPNGDTYTHNLHVNITVGSVKMDPRENCNGAVQANQNPNDELIFLNDL